MDFVIVVASMVVMAMLVAYELQLKKAKACCEKNKKNEMDDNIPSQEIADKQ